MKPNDYLFGEIAIQLRQLTREQVASCLNSQKMSKSRRPMGEICLEMGFLNQGQIQYILEQQARFIHSKARAAGPARQATVRPPTPNRKTRSPTVDGVPRVAESSGPSVDQLPRPPRSRTPTLDNLISVYINDGDPGSDKVPARPVPVKKRSICSILPRALTPTTPPPVLDSEAPSFQAPDLTRSTDRPSSRPAPAAAAPSPATAAPQPSAAAAAPQPSAAAAVPQPSQSARTSADPGHPSGEAAPAPAPAAREPVRSTDAPEPRGVLVQALQLAVQMGASDLHLHSGAPITARREGVLTPLSDETPMDSDAAGLAIAELLGEDRWHHLIEKKEMDLAFTLPNVGRFRVNAYMQQRGPDIVFRLLPHRPPSLEMLGLPADLERLTRYRTGIVLCTGPTGCGKSSTLAALLDLVVKSRKEHVITIEDPIEFLFDSHMGLVNQRQIGEHTETFARALRAALREDPDVISLTELRDPETIGLALSAAETGHLVFGSLHTGSAGQTITRIVNAFSADQQAQVRVMLSDSLRAVISQRLVTRRDGKGRVPALEVLVVTAAVANLIREDKTFQLPSVMQTGRAHGMMLLDDSLRQLVSTGVITQDEADRHSTSTQQWTQQERRSS